MLVRLTGHVLQAETGDGAQEGPDAPTAGGGGRQVDRSHHRWKSEMNENQSINQSIASVVKKKIGNLDRRRAVCQREGRNKEGRKKVCGLGGRRKGGTHGAGIGFWRGNCRRSFFGFGFDFDFLGLAKNLHTPRGMFVEKERKGKEREGRGFRYPYLPAALRRLGDTTYMV